MNNLLKIVTVLNWTIIAILGILVLLGALFPSKGGGDAAGRGLGQAIYYLAIIAFVVMLVLNLLPFKWTKYLALAFLVVPFLFYKISPVWQKYKQDLHNKAEAEKPFFDDPEQESIARIIYDGEPDKLKPRLLQLSTAKLNAGGELLAFGINTANASSYKPAERLECVRVLFEAGAILDSTTTAGDAPMYVAVASNGDAALMKLLLDHGADANLLIPYGKRPIIFEAIYSYKEPLATVKVLLEYGADPNVTAAMDDEDGSISPLVYAAKVGRWGICSALIEKGADVNFATGNGLSLRSLVAEADKDFSADGYSSKEEFEALKQVLHQKSN